MDFAPLKLFSMFFLLFGPSDQLNPRAPGALAPDHHSTETPAELRSPRCEITVGGYAHRKIVNGAVVENNQATFGPERSCRSYESQEIWTFSQAPSHWE